MLLHKSSSQPAGGLHRLQNAEIEDMQSSKSFVRNVLTDSLMKLEGESKRERRSIRWELGACWVQHLQNQASEKTDSKKSDDTKVEPTVKGLGKQFGQLKEIKKKVEDKGGKTNLARENSSPTGDDANKTCGAESANLKEDKEMLLREVLPEAAFLRLKESETGLHVKVSSAPCYVHHLLYSCNS